MRPGTTTGCPSGCVPARRNWPGSSTVTWTGRYRPARGGRSGKLAAGPDADLPPGVDIFGEQALLTHWLRHTPF